MELQRSVICAFAIANAEAKCVVAFSDVRHGKVYQQQNWHTPRAFAIANASDEPNFKFVQETLLLLSFLRLWRKLHIKLQFDSE